MRKCEIYDAERAQGKTYQEIGDMYGVTRQAVHNSVSRRSGRVLRKRWPGLLLWMEQNNMTNMKMAKEIGVSNQTFGDWLQGIHDPKMVYINRIIQITQLTYEELFCE